MLFFAHKAVIIDGLFFINYMKKTFQFPVYKNTPSNVSNRIIVKIELVIIRDFFS
jgi:hypothetical protein